MDVISSVLGRGDYLPHGYCFTWTPGLLWSMVTADAIIAAAYFSIPLAMLSFVRKRRDSSMTPLLLMFSAFIFACGITHLMDIWTIWQPDYALQALTKVVTAVISMVTAVVLWTLIPKALKIPSVAQLQAVIASLEAEVKQRRSAEESLLDTQQSLAVTLSSIDAGFIAADHNGRVTHINDVAERITGWIEADAQGRSMWEVFRREDRPAGYLAMNPVELMIEQGVTIDVAHEVVALSLAGERTHVEIKTGLTHAADGSVRGLAMVIRDQTRQQRAVLESNQLAAIVASSNDAIIGKTLDGRITSWNAAAEKIFGYRAEEAIGRRVQMLIPPERRIEEMRILAELAHGAVVPAFDTVRLTRDGRRLDISVTISPIRDARGRIIGASKIARDVTAERRAAAALQESETRLRFTLESAQIGDWDLDLATGVCNRSLRHDRCFGYSSAQQDWTFDTFLLHVHHDDREEVVESFKRAIDARSDWEIECRVRWPDDSLHWVRVKGSLLDQSGAPTHMLGIIADITEHRQIEQARLNTQRLEAENRQIQEANRLKTQFLANMSHELRTPLNAIIGFAELLHAGAVKPESPKHHEFLGHICTSGRHLLQLINDVLDLSKVESGKFEFVPEPVDLQRLVREARDILHTAIRRKHINVLIDIEPALTGLVLDPARMKQVLYNYLSNAIKFSAEGGRVTIRARAEGTRHFRLEVEDQGIGISDADLPRLFIEFQQLDAGYNKLHQGTGLGLALTRRLVEAQGGKVGVRSQPGVGSVFHLILPRVPLAAEVGQSRPESTGSAHHRFLVIEDNPGDQALITRALAAAGFNVDAASTGEQAIHHALNNPYDALTLNLMLPDQSGLGVLARIRNDGLRRDAPVLGMSMSAFPEKATRFSIADVLSKPIRSEEIVAAMAKLAKPGLQPARVLVIDDDPLALELMATTLAAIGIEAVCRLDGRAALRDLDQLRPEAIILDLMMPEFDGFAVLDALGHFPEWKDLPVYIWTSLLLTDEEYASLARSARAILSKGGGALGPMLESLSRWRPSTVAATERSDS